MLSPEEMVERFSAESIKKFHEQIVQAEANRQKR